MSWSRALAGPTPDDVRNQMGGLAAEVAEDDVKYAAHEKVAAEHQAQVQRASAALEQLFTVIPSEYAVSGNVAGYASVNPMGDLSADSVSVHVTMFRPKPASAPQG